MSLNGKIVIIDDDNEMRSLLRDYLQKQGYQIADFPNAAVALDRFRRDPLYDSDKIDLVISDIRMPEMSGLELVEKLKPTHAKTPVILITAFGSLETAVEAIRRGAFDYITKPFKLGEIDLTIKRALHVSRLEQENTVLRAEIRQSKSFANIVGQSAGMQEVFDLIGRVSQTKANVLVSGESGTGKEMVARAIHELSPRASRPFIAINCTAIPETLLESELFGHAKGSFTGAHQRKKGLFEEAEGGTLFLDEIGDMELGLQAKLLRVIQEKKIRSVGDNMDRPIDVRIIAATHKDLKGAIKAGTFREDLYYRLAVIPLVIPPLRYRKDDIPILADYFLKRFAAANSVNVRGFTREAMNRLVSMPWEGNVRELENVIERATVLCRGDIIDLIDLPVSESNDFEALYASTTVQLPTLEDLERRYIRFVLDKTGGKKEKASQILGINRRTLYRKERDYEFVSADTPEPPDHDAESDLIERHDH